MTNQVTVSINEVKKVFELLEKIHDFFHQPMNYSNTEEFAKENYAEIRDLYYDVIWKWLPEETKREYEER